jgi:glycosyltransferase involved in cell wall biosynthesis
VPHGELITVALCTHNGERFVREQLESILLQTRMPDAIVLSDDASTDRTVHVARETFDAYRVANPTAGVQLTVVQNASPLGVTLNFQQAILLAEDGLVALSDQDDVWEDSKLERMETGFAERKSLLLLHSDASLIDEAGNRIPGTLLEALEVTPTMRESIHDGRAFELLIKRNLVTGATSMIRRELAVLAAPFPNGWVHDEWLAIVAASLDGLDLLEEPLVRYRQHSCNQIGARKLGLIGKLRRLLEPGYARNHRLLLRAQSLVTRFSQLDESLPAEQLGIAQEKLQHEQMRNTLGPHRLSRLLPIAAELRTGRYSTFGRGLSDAVRDVIQPLKPVG